MSLNRASVPLLEIHYGKPQVNWAVNTNCIVFQL